MGLFDFFKKKDAAKPDAGPQLDKKVAPHAKVAADKRAQTYDRMEALQALVEMRTPEAASALLKRFAFSIDPSITDQEEKELAYEGIVQAGRPAEDVLKHDEKERKKLIDEAEEKRDKIVSAVADFCEKAEQLTWPIKVLRSLLDDDGYRDELLAVLARFDTEYARNVEPKIQVLLALEEVASPETREALEPFLMDVNETVRFTAAQTVFAHEQAESVPAFCEMLRAEESVRVKNKIAEGFVQRGWIVPQEERAGVGEALRDTEAYRLNEAGKVVRAR